MSRTPQRIVCLTTETVEVLYALGEQERIVGISGYTVRPPEARKEKPKVFAFTTGDIDKILATQPDLVLTFSDLQSEISRDLIKAGVPVYAFNMRSVEDILGMIETLGRLVGAEARALAIVATGMGDARPEWLNDWNKWPRMAAVKRGNLFHIHPDLMQRHTPRILDGAEKLCADLDAARSRRPAK